MSLKNANLLVAVIALFGVICAFTLGALFGTKTGIAISFILGISFFGIAACAFAGYRKHRE